jgi:hypothetical protein
MMARAENRPPSAGVMKSEPGEEDDMNRELFARAVIEEHHRRSMASLRHATALAFATTDRARPALKSRRFRRPSFDFRSVGQPA